MQSCAALRGGLCLLRAAHGRLRAQPASRLTSVALADHQEAVGALRGLRRGVAFTIVCASFLVGAVGFTWYGPSRLPPTVLIETDSGVVCGTVERSGAGRVAIETGSGVRDVSFDDIDGLRTVDCGARP